MLAALVVVTPLAGWDALPALDDPVAIAAGVGVGVASSVIPYVCDQLAMARLPRSTYALLVSLLPATATVIGIVVLGQVPAPDEVAGVALVVAGVAVHRDAPWLDGRVGAPEGLSGRRAFEREGPFGPVNAGSRCFRARPSRVDGDIDRQRRSVSLGSAADRR